MRTSRLVALAVLALASVLAWQWLRPAGQDSSSPVRRLLLSAAELPLDRVDRVMLERPGSPALEFRRTAGGWQQTAPYEHPADAAAIRLVVETAAAVEESRTAVLGGAGGGSDGGGVAPAALGLDVPRAVLTIGWPGGECSIELGKRTVAGRAWAHVKGRDAASSVDGSLHALAVEGDPRQWRSMALYEPALGEPVRLSIQYGTKTKSGARTEWVLERAKGKWRVVAPVSTRADDEALQGYFEAAARAQADACAADQPADFAAFELAPAVGGVAIQRAGGAPSATVEVGKPVVAGAPERFARVNGRPTVLQIGAKAISALLPPPAFFVDPRGTDVAPPDIRRIQFLPAPGMAVEGFALERARDGWLVESGAGTRAGNGESIRRLLAQLAETRAPEVSFTAMPPELRVGAFELLGADGAALAVVRVARESENGKWALDNDDGVLRVFPQNFDIRLDAASYSASR